MGRLQAALERAALAIERVAGLLMALITVLVVASAISRYLFANPLPVAFDISRFLLGAAIMWGFASVGYRGSHIKVDLLAEALPQGVRRWIDTFAWSVLLLFTCLLAVGVSFWGCWVLASAALIFLPVCGASCFNHL